MGGWPRIRISESHEEGIRFCALITVIEDNPWILNGKFGFNAN